MKRMLIVFLVFFIAITNLAFTYKGLDGEVNKVTSVTNETLTQLVKDVGMFKDIKDSDWFVETVSKLVDKGAIEGYADGTFRPNNTITRAEFTKILVSSLGYDNLAKTDTHWASGYISRAEEIKLIGKGELKNIDKPITRNEMAKMCANALDYLGEFHVSDRNLFRSQIKDFDKIPKEYQDYVLKSYSKGIITGYPDGEYKGNQGLTRAEASTVIIRVIDKTERKTVKIPVQYTKEDLLKSINKEEVLEELRKYPSAYKDKSIQDAHEIYGGRKGATWKIPRYYEITEKTMTNLFTRNYKTINNKEYKEGVLLAFQSWWRYKNESFSPEGFIDEWIKDTKEYKIEQEAIFITDPTMVYYADDGNARVRGRLYFRYINHENPENIKYEMLTYNNIEIGKWYVVDIDVKWVVSLTNAPIKESTGGIGGISNYGENYYLCKLKELEK